MKLIAITFTRFLGCTWRAQGLLALCWLAAVAGLPGSALGSASAQQSIRIAAIFASSGQAAAADVSSLQGVRWAVDEINAAGGVLGRPLEVIELDNRSTPIGANAAAKQADASFAAAIIGPGYSSQALAVARVAQAKFIPMISSAATNPKLTRIGNYIFRVCFSDDQQARVMGRFAFESLNYRKVLTVVNISSDYSMGLVANAIERAASTERSAIRDALAETKEFRGVTGTLSFNTHGDPVKTVIIVKILDGRPYFLKQVRAEY